MFWPNSPLLAGSSTTGRSAVEVSSEQDPLWNASKDHYHKASPLIPQFGRFGILPWRPGKQPPRSEHGLSPQICLGGETQD